MAVVSGLGFGRDLCKVLKLDPAIVSHITIDVGFNDVVKVLVKRYLTIEESEELTSLLQQRGKDGVVIEEKIDVR